MDITIDPIMGEARQTDYTLPLAKNPADGTADSAEIAVLRGGEKYVFPIPLKSLNLESVRDSPFESEIIFTAGSGLTPASRIYCGIQSSWRSVEHILNQDDSASTGNSRTFSAEFEDDDPDANGYGHWKLLAFFDPNTRKWTIHSEFNGEKWEKDPDTGEWRAVQYSFEGVFATATEADVALELVEWGNFNYDCFPQGHVIRNGAYVENDAENSPPVISIPASVGIIGSLPGFEPGKRYILNFRDNLVVGAEIH